MAFALAPVSGGATTSSLRSGFLGSVPSAEISTRGCTRAPRPHAADVSCSQQPSRVFEAGQTGRRKLVSNVLALTAIQVLAPLASRPAAAADDLASLLVPILQANEIVGQIPAAIEAENWDGIRNMVFKPPVGLLKTTMAAAAKALEGDDEMDALEELYDILENLRNIDINVYTCIFIPSPDYQVKYINFAKDAYRKTQDNLDTFFAIVERNHAEELGRAREIAANTPINQKFF